MARWLQVVDGADHGRAFPLPDSGTIILGASSKHCDICLNDLYVSRVHCQVEIEEEHVAISDLSTATGTFLNKQKVQRQEMQRGDVIRIGNTHLRLETGASIPAAPARTETQPEAKPALPQVTRDRLGELANHMVGHYELGMLLGKGHYGTVFRAQDLKKHQTVALKVLGPSFPANEAEMQRFVATFKRLLPLRHPNLLTLLGVGRSSGYCWIAREYVDGESAADFLTSHRSIRRPDWRVGYRVALHIGRALEFTHQQHLIHGNITPHNILLPDDQSGPKLANLLLSQALEDSVLQKEVLEAKLLAEMPYLSPEQVDPEAYADDLCDLYGLGAVVYALLTGRPPFVANTPEKLLAAICEGNPEKPRKYQKHIPMELQAVVLKMLARRPEERYPTPAQLVADLAPIAAEHGLDFVPAG